MTGLGNLIFSQFFKVLISMGGFFILSVDFFLRGWRKNGLRIRISYSNERAKKHNAGNIG
jgi:hypothetical protein